MHPPWRYGDSVHCSALFLLPLYLSSTSSYAWANSFSCEWFVGSRPGMNPAMVALQAGWRVERGRPAECCSDPVRCCASSLQLRILVLVGLQSNTTSPETSDALAHTESPVAHFQAGLDNPQGYLRELKKRITKASYDENTLMTGVSTLMKVT